MNALHQPPLPEGVCPATVQDGQRGSATPAPRQDWLAEEIPVALVVNDISFAVMMVTPADLDDFALGFALTEGVIASKQDLYSVEQREVTTQGQRGIELHLHVAAASAWRLKEHRRAMAGRTGCGICGAESLAQVQRPLPQAPTVHVAGEALLHAQHALRSWQALQQLTGASHAAAWCNLQGQVLLAREDVGRHNALDKLIGALHNKRAAPTDMQQGFILITSRASFEMVQKSVMAGAGVLAAVSAPTALAVDTAQQSNLALAGFVRQNSWVGYSFAERFESAVLNNAI